MQHTYPGFALVQICENGSEYLRKDFGPNPVLYQDRHQAEQAKRQLEESHDGIRLEIRRVRVHVEEVIEPAVEEKTS